jgi:peptidoglycan hydrolase-like protein with peptidoglycan-binding domain
VLRKVRPTNLVPAVLHLPDHLMGAPAAPAAPVDWVKLRRFIAAMLVPQLERLPVLRQGASGPAVETVQHALNLGDARLTVDGSFGPSTSAAVKTFQRRAGLAADGIVGSQTRWWLATSARAIAEA